MDRDTVLTFLRAQADALRLQASGYSVTSTSKIRAGLIAHAEALEQYATSVEAMPIPEPPYSSSPILLLLI